MRRWLAPEIACHLLEQVVENQSEYQSADAQYAGRGELQLSMTGGRANRRLIEVCILKLLYRRACVIVISFIIFNATFVVCSSVTDSGVRPMSTWTIGPLDFNGD